MKLKQITGNEIEIPLTSEIVQDHYLNPANYMQVVVDEFNQEPFKDYISPEDKVILDIGANVGLFALHVLPYVERIVCIEPTPEHMAVQKELLTAAIINGRENGDAFKTVDMIETALHNYTGEVGWHVEPVNTTMNKINVDRMGSGMVPCITLFDLCKKYDLNHVYLCKIDIEGGEFAALTVETIRPVKSIIDKILIEVHPRTLESQNHFKAIFEECGYKVELFDFNGGLFVYR